MEFLRLESDDYESALRLAREKWGSAVRVHTRRDIPVARGPTRCEITFYLVDLSKQVRFDPQEHREKILKANDIPAGLSASADVWASIETMQQAEVEVRLIEELFTSIDYTAGLGRRFVHLMGAGAAAMAPRLALYHRAKERKKVAILTLGSDEPSLVEAAALYSLPLYHATGRAEFEALGETLERYERVVLLAPDDAMRSLIEGEALTRLLVTDATALERDDADALLVTGLEKAEKIGALLAYLVQSKVTFAYTADDEGEVRAADSSALLSRLVGFTLDLEALSFL